MANRRDTPTGARRRSHPHYPRPPGSTVEIKYASGNEEELIKHRILLNSISALHYECSDKRWIGRGIVIPGGGHKYLPSAYVLVRMLRSLHCKLPIEIWHIGEEEMPPGMRTIFEDLDCMCVDADRVRRINPIRRLGGWELKCYSIMNSAFREVLLLDADNCPVRDPEYLFDSDEYEKTGAIFWPDYTRFSADQAVWKASDISYQDEPEFESGQIVVDKQKCWKALNIAMHMNEFSEWWYRVIHGDKDTFHLAWRKIGQSYSMPRRQVEPIEATMLQFDFEGRLLFQHRNFAKWRLDENQTICGFRFEKRCFSFIAKLRELLANSLFNVT